jgi:hypothetical protein
MAKQNYIAINQMIWTDPEARALSPSAFSRFVFLIAWSKSTKKNGRFSDFALQICGGSQEDLQELINAKVVVRTEEGDYLIRTFGEWQQTAEVVSQAASEAGRLGAEKRWKPPAPAVVDGNFDIDQAAAASWALWPDASEPKFREKRTEGIQAFKENITSAEDYLAFQAALQHRLSAYRSEQSHERRRFLGAFKNFCTKWPDWVPKNYGVTAAPPAAPAIPVAVETAPPVEAVFDSSKPLSENPEDFKFLFKDE